MAVQRPKNAEQSDSCEPANFQLRKQTSVAQLLFKIARLWNQQALERLRQRFPGIRPVHTTLLPHLDWEGTRITELARRMGVTKQAASQLVQDMVGQGLLEIGPDAEDGRARRVFFSLAGQQALQTGLSVLMEMQTELTERFGSEQMQDLLALLQQLLPLLESEP